MRLLHHLVQYLIAATQYENFTLHEQFFYKDHFSERKMSVFSCAKFQINGISPPVRNYNNNTFCLCTFLMLYTFFWVIPPRLNFIRRRFGTLCLLHLHRQVDMKNSSYLPTYEDGADRMFRNVGIYNSDARELPRRKHTTFRTRRKFEIKNTFLMFVYDHWSVVTACR